MIRVQIQSGPLGLDMGLGPVPKVKIIMSGQEYTMDRTPTQDDLGYIELGSKSEFTSIASEPFPCIWDRQIMIQTIDEMVPTLIVDKKSTWLVFQR